MNGPDRRNMRAILSSAEKVRDVVKGPIRDESVEGPGVGELLERDGVEEIAPGGFGVDGHNVVACASDGQSELTAPAADLEHASGLRWQVLCDK